MDHLKNNYAQNQIATSAQSERLNQRLFRTYNRIALMVAGKQLSGSNIDLGAGDRGFSAFCASHGIDSRAIDYPEFNLETGKLDMPDSSVDFVTMNAVLEHISSPGNILSESNRVLKPAGLLFIRTPNWQLDSKNFYNDPTHVRPYSPATIITIFKLFNFSVLFVEPGLIEKSSLWWQLPDIIKWKVASYICGGTKSIIAVGRK